ncbi:Protein CBG03149 [Caenorhabditis briggsae]|uniref:Protein CBG03149 n=2 Tax=Caenorhabditis briggsae TaxID=6238 RepID=A8WSN9_CAEBR|nr:Protein CBG03149 [Caenorhabditis briggsae]CAP23498.2 Protein CBG03149 [Caenorhabditis briggsae]
MFDNSFSSLPQHAFDLPAIHCARMDEKKQKKHNKNSKKPDVPHSFYFYLVLRFLATICCIIVVFIIGLSQYWTNRVSAVFGMLFVIIALLFSASAVSILFIWDVNTTTIVKRCLFSFVYALSILIAAVMFLIANDGCDPRMISQFGCYQSVSTGTFQVSSAFCFLIFVFGLLDLGLNAFYFWRNSKRSPIYDYPPPSVAVVETEKTIHDIYMEYQRKGQTTSV